MKLKIILMFVLALSVGGCISSRQTSKFVSDNIELGMDKKTFIKKFGTPFASESTYTSNHQKEERLFYKEELYKDSWFIITTAFTFMDDKLTKQEIVKEERSFIENNGKK